METLPTKRSRLSNQKGKKGGKAFERICSLKGKSEKNDIADQDMSVAQNDHGFRDMRTLTEKMRLLSWVQANSYSSTNQCYRQMHIMNITECSWGWY
jgi:hypothetical protein